jgi:hypothetical protein
MKALLQSGVDPNDILSMKVDRQDVLTQNAFLLSKINLLRSVNGFLEMTAKCLLNQTSEPRGLKERLDPILHCLSWEKSEAELVAAKQKCIDLQAVAHEAEVKKDSMDNQKATTLFIALATKVSDVCGPKTLKAMVREIFGPVLFGIAIDGPFEDGEGLMACQVTTSEDAIPRELAPTLLESLKNSSFDFILKDSKLSELLASELRVPSMSSTEVDIEKETKVPWRVCPAEEFNYLKSMNQNYMETHQRLISILEEHSQGPASSDPPQQINANEQSKINSLVAYVLTMQDQAKALLDALFDNVSVSKDDYGLDLFSVAEPMIVDLVITRRDLRESLNQTRTRIDALISKVPSLAAEVKISTPDDKKSGQDEFKLRYIADAVKALAKSRDDALKENVSLQKSIPPRDKTINEQATEILRAREFRGMREEKLSEENLKLESEISDFKQKLEKALKRPDEVRAEFSGKLQRLHDKVRNLEGTLKEEKQNHEILKLDNAASVEELEKCQSKITKYKEAIEKHKEAYIKLKVENERLRVAQSHEREAELQDLLKFSRETNIRERKLADEKNSMEAELKKLQSERQVDLKTIQELSQRKEELKEQVSAIPALEKALETSEEVLHSTMNELEKERAKVSIPSKDEAFSTLEKKLAEECAKSKQLETMLAPFLAAAAAAASLSSAT